jgi:hypothetical protein
MARWLGNGFQDGAVWVDAFAVWTVWMTDSGTAQVRSVAEPAGCLSGVPTGAIRLRAVRKSRSTSVTTPADVRNGIGLRTTQAAAIPLVMGFASVATVQGLIGGDRVG